MTSAPWRPPYRVRGWGPKAILKRIEYRLYDIEAAVFDWILGVETRGYKDTKDFVQGYNYYAPVFSPTIWLALRQIKRRCRAWRTIDVGGGKGKVAIVAWLSRFRNLGYVELDPELCKIAERNFSHLGVDVKTVQGDALRQAYPDRVCLLLYNPFQRETTERFLDGLAGCRELVIVYINAQARDVFVSRGFLVRRFPGFEIYERLEPRGAGAPDAAQ